VTGAGGTTAIGSGGAPAPQATCASLSTVVGQANPCGRIYGVAYSPDGQLLAAARQGESPNVHVWRLSDGALVHSFDGTPEGSYSIAFSPDGKQLASGGVVSGGQLTAVTPDIVKVWDLATGGLVRTVPATCGFYADSVAYSHDGTLLATAGAVGPVELWRANDGTRVAAIPYPTSVHNVHFSPDDSQLIVGGVDEKVTIWNVPAATLAATLAGTAGEMADGAFSPNGQRIATTGVGNVIKIWNAASGTLLQSLSGHNQYVSHVVWIDDAHVVTDDWGGTVISWAANAGTFAQSNTWSIGAQALGMAISPDRARLAIGGDNGITFLSP